MKRAVTMGEMMIRLMPPENLRFEQAMSFNVFWGGDESIVAAFLARCGVAMTYVTKLPEGVFGDIAIQHLRTQGIDTSCIARGGKRIGLNFYENGASVRPSRVIYDRENSAVAEAEESDFNFDAIFRGADWFHVSGITPALSDGMAAITMKALQAAKKHGATVSFDLNYRRRLWSPEKAREVVSELMQYVDVCIGNEEDAAIMLGFKPKSTNVEAGRISVDDYKEIFEAMRKAYGFKIVASTLRESHSASDNGWSSIAYDGKEFCVSRKYNLHLVDRGGGGASFAAGLIRGLLKGATLKEATEFAAAASALKQTIVGDFNLVTEAEVVELVNGNASGRVQR
jgi:2-dehydro-3-deoxygluconokinase